MKLAIVIPTYQRNDGKSFQFLKKCLTSIKNQTYKDYCVYLIGDKYEDNEEFESIANSIIDKDKIKYINLPHAVERKKYSINSKELAFSGGVNSTNVGISMALENGLNLICHLDHDDFWENNHLFEINEVINRFDNCAFITTTAKRLNTNIVAPIEGEGIHYPYPGSVYHSATCVDFKRIPLRYKDVFMEEGRLMAADANLWVRITEYMKKNNLIGYHTNKITCYHTNHHYDIIK
jgi:glycosyltransferase involved in cell wall biosynthesis